jgi:SP family general alpha glucoside:H+ symporter-like MFS transporter
VFGQILGSGILIPLTKRTDHWAYRIPFAVQWVWVLPIFILVTLAPESPWYLVRKGKLDQAEKAVERLTNVEKNTIHPKQTVAMMVRTNEHEQIMQEGVSYMVSMVIS